MKNLFTILFFFCGIIAMSAQCDYTLVVEDSFGDGMNGAVIDIDVNGTVVSSVSSTGGLAISQAITVNTGDVITIIEAVSGAWDGEIAWTLYDCDANAVGSNASFAAGSSYGFPPAVDTSIPGTTSTYTITFADSFGDGFNNGTGLDIVINGAVTGAVNPIYEGTGTVSFLYPTDGSLTICYPGSAGGAGTGGGPDWASEVSFEVFDDTGASVGLAAAGDFPPLDGSGCFDLILPPVTLDVFDPCDCANPNNLGNDLDGDGLVDEVLYVEETITVTCPTCTGPDLMLDIVGGYTGVPVDPATATPLVGLQAVTADAPGTFIFTFYHEVSVGYTADVQFNGVVVDDIANVCDPCCDLVCPDDVVEVIGSGDCGAVVFYDIGLTGDCVFTFPGVVPAGTFDGDGNATITGVTATGFTLTGDGSGAPAGVGAYSSANTIVMSGIGAGTADFTFDYDFQNTDSFGDFWDPFVVTVNGTVVTNVTANGTGSVIVPGVVDGDVVVFDQTSDGDYEGTGLSAGNTGTTIVSNMALSITGPLVPVVSPAEFVSGAEFPVGITTVTVTVPAGFLADSDCTFDVEVIAPTVPVQSLACNDHVNISVDDACSILFSSDMFLEGGPYACYDDYVVTIVPNNVESLAFDVDPDVPVNLGGFLGDHTYMVTSPEGNTCWGTFTVEDKLGPLLECRDITISCIEYAAGDVIAYPTPALTGAVANAPVFVPGVASDGSAVLTEVVSVALADGAVISDVNVALTYQDDNSNGQDNDLDDLAVTITNLTTGTSVLITPPNWGPAFCGEANLINFVLDNEAPAGNGCPDFTSGGTFSSPGFGDLTDFIGEDPTADWQIDITNSFAGEVYTNISVGIIVTYDAPAVPPSTFDNCGVTFEFSDSFSDSGCAGGNVVRQWIATDASGNTSVCTQNIVVENVGLDGLGTIILTPFAEVDLPCGTGTSPEDIAAYFDDPTTEDDESAGGSSCNPTSPSIVENNEGYEYAYPYYSQLGCDGTYHNQKIDNNVCSVFVSYSDTAIPACGGECSGNLKVIRTWTLIDWCDQTGGAPTTFIQIIKAVDDVAPEITAGAPIQLSVSPWGCVASGVLPAPEHLFDACSGPDLAYTVSGPAGVTVTSMDGSGNAPYMVIGAPKGLHPFTYTTVDCCGNTNSSVLMVNVIDDTPPVAIAKEQIVVSLTSGGSDVGGYAQVYTNSIDNGSHDGDCGPIKLEVRRPSGAPICGNVGIDGYNNNVTFNNDRHDDDFDDDTDGGAFVKFCCDDLAAGNTYTGINGDPISYQDSMVVILRVWDDGNCDGILGNDGDNYNETWAYVQVENKLPPVILCPDDVTVDCDEDFFHSPSFVVPDAAQFAVMAGPEGTGVASGAGVCGGVVVGYSDSAGPNACYDNEVTRTWALATLEADGTYTATSTTCRQKISFNYSSGLQNSDINWPQEEIFTDCMDEAATSTITWNDVEPCALIGWSVDSQTFTISQGSTDDDACIKVINTYTVVDWCSGDEFSFVQTIKLIDEIAPTIDVDVTCIPVTSTTCTETITLCATGYDDSNTTGVSCPSQDLYWQVVVDLYSDWQSDATYSSYSDPSNNRFPTGAEPWYIPTTESAGELCVQLPMQVSSSKYTHRAVWTLSDGCNNITSFTDEFTIEDKKAPTPYCHSVSSALMAGDNPMVELWACDFVVDGIDNCTSADEMRYTFSNVAPEDLPQEDPEDGSEWYNPETKCSAKAYTCADIGGANSGVVEVEVYFWDECGNSDFCTVELTLNGPCTGEPDGAGRIAGDVSTEYGEMVQNVAVSVTSAQPEYPMTLTTDANGQYDSEGHAFYQDYALNAYSNDNPRNGVSTLDIVLIQRHILNLQSLSSAYQYIAADANADQNITAADLVDIRKLILEVTDVFPNNDSWRFVDANQALTTANAFAFNETLDILSLSANMETENFVAVKIGDVNGNAAVNANSTEAELRSGKNLALQLAGTATAEGVSVAVTSSNFADIAGYQFTMNTNGLELTNVEAGAIAVTDENIAVIDGSTLTMSWNTLNAASVEGEVLFTLHFAGSDVTSVDGMTISSDVTNAEAYDADLNIMNVVLGDVENADNALLQNVPNPFETETMIEFSLATAGTATLKVLDVTGKVIKQITNTYAKGMNSVVLSKNDLGVSGVLYYTLESGDYSATKKMIIIE